MKDVRQLVIRRSLIRPILLGGGERELVIVNITFACALVFGVGMNKFTLISAIFLMTIGQIILNKLANADPMLSKVYQRHIHYQEYYLAKASRLARTPIIKPSIK
jgi:type IV secretory pathway TrbD component